jgi:hypothetical protein
LSNLGIAGLLEKMDKPTVTIATTGSLYKHHPRMSDMLTYYTKLYAPNRTVSLFFDFSQTLNVKSIDFPAGL